MHIFKHLLLTACCITTATLSASQQVDYTPETTRAAISILNRKVEETLKLTEALQNQVTAKLHKATKRGWPLSARLATLALAGYIAWEHKEEIKDEARSLIVNLLESAPSAQQEQKREEVIRQAQTDGQTYEANQKVNREYPND